MTTDYPGALDEFDTKVDNVDDVMAADVNNLQDSMEAVQAELGVDPAGDEADVVTRLDNMLDLDGSREVVWDADGDSKTYSTVDDEVIHTAGGAESFTTKGVGIGMPVGKDVYPGGASVGLQYRFEQLFGDNVPANPYHYTNRDFLVNNFPGGVAGFEDSQTSPYSFGGSPGGFSVTVPANTLARSNHMAHFLTLQNQSGTGVYMEWTDSTAVNNIIVTFAPAPLWTASDYNLAEIRMWGVQAPGAADNYWAMRINWMGATFPDYPMRMGLWYGTGVTYAHNDGTVTQMQVPHWGDGMVGRLHAVVVAGPTCYMTPSAGEGGIGVGVSNTQAGWPTSVKTVRIRLDVNYTYFHIDTFRAV